MAEKLPVTDKQASSKQSVEESPTPKSEPNSEEEPIELASSPLKDDTRVFIQHINSLKESLFMAMVVMMGAHEKAHKDMDAFVKLYCDRKEENGKTYIKPKLHDYCKKYSALRKAVDQSHITYEVVPQCFLVALVSKFDGFIRSFLRHLLLLNRNTLKGSHATLSVADLLSYDTVEKAYEFVVDSELDAPLRGSHTALLKYIGETFDLGWRKDELWKNFIEITERRNLFVHTNGVVSAQYIDVCRQNGVKVSEDIAEGKPLPVTPAYFKEAKNIVLELGIKLSQVLWRKQLPDGLRAADESLGDVTFDLLCERQFKLAKNLLEFATEELGGKYSNPDWPLIYRVNLAIAYKEMNDVAKLNRCLASLDWRETHQKFQLAEAVLSERYHHAVVLMKSLGQELGKTSYRDWPLFTRFRETSQFKVTYREIFGEDFQKEIEVREQMEAEKCAEPMQEPETECESEELPTVH